MELIEFSFLQPCVALSKGSVEPLQLFVAAVKAARESERRFRAADLIEAIGSSSSPALGRPLDRNERNLRSTWIGAIYLVLERAGEETPARMQASTRAC